MCFLGFVRLPHYIFWKYSFLDTFLTMPLEFKGNASVIGLCLNKREASSKSDCRDSQRHNVKPAQKAYFP